MIILSGTWFSTYIKTQTSFAQNGNVVQYTCLLKIHILRIECTCQLTTSFVETNNNSK